MIFLQLFASSDNPRLYARLATPHSDLNADLLKRLCCSCFMKVKRIVANIETKKIAAAKRFYEVVLGLDILMDLGWIATYGSNAKMPLQISFMSEGGSGTPVPDLSIEVDNVDEAFKRMKKARFKIEYPLTDEPWGVRRFYVRDPLGKLVNILAHT
jgi:catechol 2,3-dioxygenase-like lactoylglutathione lyase family enzyme